MNPQSTGHCHLDIFGMDDLSCLSGLILPARIPSTHRHRELGRCHSTVEGPVLACLDLAVIVNVPVKG